MCLPYFLPWYWWSTPNGKAEGMYLPERRRKRKWKMTSIGRRPRNTQGSSSVKCHRSHHSQMSLHHLSPLFFSPAARPQAAILQRKEGTFDAATNSAKIRPNQPLRRFEPKSFFVGNHIGSTITVATTASPTLHRYPFSTSSKSHLQCIPARAKKKAS